MATVKERVAGYLETGIVWRPSISGYEVMVNFPETVDDKAHHVAFSPNQARDFAALLVKKADEAEQEPPP